MLAASASSAASSIDWRGWYGFARDPVERDLGRRVGLPGTALRDERGEAAPEALRSLAGRTVIDHRRLRGSSRVGDRRPRRRAVPSMGAAAALARRVAARNSAASSRYASAPFESGRYSAIGSPWLGASDRRTLRGMTVS